MKNLKRHIYRPFAISVAIGAVSVLAALVLCAAAVYAMQLPVEICGGLGVISLCTGCAVSGFALGAKKRRQGLKQGFLCGAALFLLCLTGGIFFGSVTAAGFFGRLLACIVSGAVGGVLGVNNTIIK